MSTIENNNINIPESFFKLMFIWFTHVNHINYIIKQSCSITIKSFDFVQNYEDNARSNGGTHNDLCYQLLGSITNPYL